MSDMREGRISYSHRESVWLHILLWAFFIGLGTWGLFVESAEGVRGFQSWLRIGVVVPVLALPVVMSLAIRADEKRRAEYEVVFDKTHIRLEQSGEVEWRLDWKEYRGYRRVGKNKSARYHFSLVDRNGRADYALPAFGFLPGMTPQNQIDLQRLLVLNAPVGGELPSRYVGKLWKKPTVWAAIVVGAVVTLASAVFNVWYPIATEVDTVLFVQLIPWIKASMVALLLGIAVLASGILELVNLRKVRRDPPAPQEITAQDHVLTLYDALSVGRWLNNRNSAGVYAPIDKAMLRAKAVTELRSWWGSAIFVAGVSSILPFTATSGSRLAAILVALLLASLVTVPAAFSIRSLKRLISSADLEFEVADDGELRLLGDDAETCKFIKMASYGQSKTTTNVIAGPAHVFSGSQWLTVPLKAFVLQSSAPDGPESD